MLIKAEVDGHCDKNYHYRKSTQGSAGIRVSEYLTGLSLIHLLYKKSPPPCRVLSKGTPDDWTYQGCENKADGHESTVDGEFGFGGYFIDAEYGQCICTGATYSLEGSKDNPVPAELGFELKTHVEFNGTSQLIHCLSASASNRECEQYD